jgi:gliding motility-associated-like protein
MYSVTVSNSCGSLSDSVYFPPCPDCIIDLPNAFSPNEDGMNDVLFILGSNFTRVQLTIYNRYGEKVFETRDATVGWDGTYNGKLQPNEVYYYYLNADCLNGQRIQKKGDITLLK